MPYSKVEGAARHCCFSLASEFLAMERAAGFNNPGAAAPEPSVENAINGSGSLEQRLSELSVEDRRSGHQSGHAEPWTPPIPVHVVTYPAELPVAFLKPNSNQELVIGFDCEGVELARYGRLCVMQLAFNGAVYLVDAVAGGVALIQACKLGLESPYVKKFVMTASVTVRYDFIRVPVVTFRRTVEKLSLPALYFQYNIKLNNVFDTQIAYNLLEEQHGKILKSDHISFVNLLADGRYCGVHYDEKEEVRQQLKKDPQFWTRRPWNEMMKRVAADDVRFLLHIHERMSESLTELSKWRLSVRSSLYCRCFCSVDPNFQPWHVPPFTGEVDGKLPEYEILSVIDVPPGKMGRVIGVQGDSIRHIKKSFRCDIFIEKQRGPPDKIFLIGMADEVLKAKNLVDIIVGRLADTVTFNPSYRGTMPSRPMVRPGPSLNRGIKIIDPQTGAEIQFLRREGTPNKVA